VRVSTTGQWLKINAVTNQPIPAAPFLSAPVAHPCHPREKNADGTPHPVGESREAPSIRRIQGGRYVLQSLQENSFAVGPLVGSQWTLPACTMARPSGCRCCLPVLPAAARQRQAQPMGAPLHSNALLPRDQPQPYLATTAEGNSTLLWPCKAEQHRRGIAR
jgi:hypothetical protein